MIEEVFFIFSRKIEASQNYTNAYMLMYRKVGLPVEKIDLGEIPDYIREAIDTEDKAEQIVKLVFFIN